MAGTEKPSEGVRKDSHHIRQTTSEKIPMIELSPRYIEKQVADSKAIFQRGLTLYEFGAFNCVEADPKNGNFVYEVDGNYGDYTTRISLEKEPSTVCDCPYPGSGCKHTVAVMLDAFDRIQKWRTTPVETPGQQPLTLDQERFLTAGEIRKQALEDRANRAKKKVHHPPRRYVQGGT